MPKYSCPHCQESFDSLFDVSLHLPTHAVVKSDTPVTERKPDKLTISDLASVPDRVAMPSDLPRLYDWYNLFNETFDLELPYTLLRWIRRSGRNNLGTFTWTSYPRNKQWTYQEDGDIYCRISLAQGRTFQEVLNTLIHEMVHFAHSIAEGFESRTWEEAHGVGTWWYNRKEKINYQLEHNYNSPIRITSRGGDINKEELETHVKNTVQIGDTIRWVWDKYTGTSTVRRRNKRTMSVHTVHTSYPRASVLTKIPYVCVAAINDEMVIPPAEE